MTLNRIPGSFRDPKGYVYVSDKKEIVTRSVTCKETFAFFSENEGAIHELADLGLILPFEVSEKCENLRSPRNDEAVGIITQPCLDMITYPYEWTFAQLKQAAILQLKLNIECLERGWDLSDASSYNVQFRNGVPVHIDILSIIPYQRGSLWEGYNQFCRHYLAPLLLVSQLQIPFNQTLKSNIDGIKLDEFYKLLGVGSYLKHPSLLFHIYFQAKNISKASAIADSAQAEKSNRLSKTAKVALMKEMLNLIQKLHSKSNTYWKEYSSSNSYSEQEKDQKLKFIAENVSKWNIKSVIDIGGNSGDYVHSAFAGGAKKGILCDIDPEALQKAKMPSLKSDLTLHTLCINWCDPSPGLGWKNQERSPLAERIVSSADCVFALALIHHIVLANNVPLSEFMSSLPVSSKYLCIEFIDKTDPMVVGMLRNREDVFSEYNKENFERELATNYEIIDQRPLKDSRTIYFAKKYDDG
jgi:ribosomal protein L11 methylase PrmA